MRKKQIHELRELIIKAKRESAEYDKQITYYMQRINDRLEFIRKLL